MKHFLSRSSVLLYRTIFLIFATTSQISALEPVFTVPLNGELPPGFELREPLDESMPLGPEGSGVSDQPGSVAFDNTSATGMGMGKLPDENKGRAISADANGSMGLAEISSFTICGWYQADDTNSAGARILSTRLSLYAHGIELLFQFGGLVLMVNEARVVPDDFPVRPGEWVFFAVTSDAESGTIKFYTGTKSEPVALVSEHTAETDTHVSSSAPTAFIGNSPQLTRPFKGFLDRVRVYAVDAGSEGALSEQEIEAIRSEDLKK